MPGAVDDLSNAKPAAVNAVKVAQDVWTLLNSKPENFGDASAKLAANFVGDLTHSTTLLGMIIDLGEQLIANFLDLLAGGRADSLEGARKLAQAVLSEFLGVEISMPPFQGGKGGEATLSAAATIGKALYDRFGVEFNVPPATETGPGEKAAQLFSGYAINFSAQNAVIGLLADALSLHELEQLRGVGEDVARSLGLGRLQRLALGTLLQQAIQKPYQRELAARLHPDRLSVPEYIHAHNRGDITYDELRQNLLETGYRDQDILAVIKEYTDKLGVGELATLVKYGQLTQDDAIKQLMQQGLDTSTAAWRLQAVQFAALNDNIKAFADAVTELYKSCRMDEETFDKLMALTPWSADEILWTKRAAGLYREYKDMMLTWTQVITAYENGIVDVDYVEAWLKQKNYSQDDQLNMELLLAVKFDAFAAAAAKKGKTASAAPTPKTAP